MTTIKSVLQLGLFGAALCASPAMATASVQLFTSIGPARVPFVNGMSGYEETSPNFATYQANVFAGLRAGGVAEGAPGLPGSFTPSSSTNFAYTDTFATSFHSWRGVVSPSGAYAKEYGTYVRTSGLVTSSTPFTLSDVYQSYSDPNGPVAPDNFADLEGSFGGVLEGLSYGPDGVKGSSDDILYDVTNPGVTLR